MVSLVEKLESIRREMFDEESELLHRLNHPQNDHYGSISRQLITLAQKRAVIKAAIDTITAATYHYKYCHINNPQPRVAAENNTQPIDLSLGGWR